MSTIISGQSPDTQAAPTVFAWLAYDRDGAPILKIDNAAGDLLEVAGITARELLQPAQRALVMWRELDPCECKRCQTQREDD